MDYYKYYLNKSYQTAADAISVFNEDRDMDNLERVGGISKDEFMVNPILMIISHDIRDMIYDYIKGEFVDDDFIKYIFKIALTGPYFGYTEIELKEDMDRYFDVDDNDNSDGFFEMMFNYIEKEQFNKIATIYFRKQKIKKLQNKLGI